MLVGDKAVFAIEWELIAEDHTLGQFCFWIQHQMIGDWDDTAHLRSCVSWIEAFVNNPKEYYANDIFDQPKEDVLAFVFDAYINNDPGAWIARTRNLNISWRILKTPLFLNRDGRSWNTKCGGNCSAMARCMHLRSTFPMALQ